MNGLSRTLSVRTFTLNDQRGVINDLMMYLRSGYPQRGSGTLSDHSNAGVIWTVESPLNFSLREEAGPRDCPLMLILA